MLTIGKKLPKFSLLNQDHATITEKNFIGHYSVLYFYPKNDTPGCTQQACDFTSSIAEFNKLEAPVYGVSPDSVKKHQNFIEKYKLKIQLLADPDKKFCETIGVIGEKKLYGKSYMGVLRTTFIIDPQGKVVEIFENVKVAGHIESIKETIEFLIKR